MDRAALVSEWDSLIRAGRGREVVPFIETLVVRDVPKSQRPVLAQLARRLGLYGKGFDLLRDEYLARREHKGLTDEPLMAEYAALLTEVGATRIAERILSRFALPAYPMTRYYRGLMWMKCWEHERALLEFQAFGEQISEPYWRNMADLNIAACLIFLGRHDEAGRVIAELGARELTAMATGILSELRGQHLFFSGKRTEARAHFARSGEVLNSAHNPSVLFAEKWVLICDLLDRPWAEVERRYRLFAEKARGLGFWELTRELDRFLALKFGDETLLAKLYFGSPAEGYKRMICRDLKWNPPESYSHTLAPGKPPGENIFDLNRAELLREGTVVRRVPGMVLALLRALAADLYKPMAVGSLFEMLYPGEYFDPSFAGQRVHTVIHRFRKFMETNRLPLSVAARDLGFVLQADDSFALRYGTGAPVNNGKLTSLSEKFGRSQFTARDAAAVLDISLRSASRLLSDQVRGGSLEKSGRGNKVKYRLAG